MKFAAAVTLGLLGLGSIARADEDKIPLKDVPKAVMDAVKAKFPGAEMKEASKETEDGKTTFEVALTSKGKNIDVALTPEGKITEVETEMAAKDLPAAVSKTLKDKYPKGTIKKAEEILAYEGGKETKSFEVLVGMAEEKTVEVKLSPEGKILKMEEDDEDDEKDDDKDK